MVPNELLPVGARLQHFSHNWEAISSWAHSVVSNGLGWEWIRSPPPLRLFHQRETPELLEFVSNMTSKGVIERCKVLRFQGRLFSVEKRDSLERRVILDLSHLNLFIRCDKFKMTTVAQVRTLLPLGAFTCSIDLSDAFWHVPVAERFRSFLGFSLGRKRYRFRAMPFGLNVAPRIFTKLASSVVRILRMRGIQIVAYLDDWLIWASSPRLCQEALEETMSLLQNLGFRINLKKSRLTPQRVFVWLGLKWDLRSHTLSIPLQKRKLAASMVRRLLRSPLTTRRKQESVHGFLQFLSVAIPILKIRLKDFQRVWRGRARKSLRDRLSPRPRAFRRILLPWSRESAFNKKVPLSLPPISEVIHTDASKTGWGGHSKRKQVQGTWSPLFRTFHINFLELMAVFLTLRKLRPPRGSHIRLVLDNQTAVLCIKRGDLGPLPSMQWFCLSRN